MGSTLAVAAFVLTVSVVVVWGTRTVVAEQAQGAGQGQQVRRPPRVRRLDAVLWALGLAWGAALLGYLGIGLTGL